MDPDEVCTWPAALCDALAEAVADWILETAASDLEVPLSDTEVTALLDGRPLRVYHATRLLAHEIESVRGDGLHALTPELVERRIGGAVNAGAITATDAERFRAQTVYANGSRGRRSDQVCAVAGLSAFTEGWRGVWPLLNTWGGVPSQGCSAEAPRVDDRAARRRRQSRNTDARALPDEFNSLGIRMLYRSTMRDDLAT